VLWFLCLPLSSELSSVYWDLIRIPHGSWGPPHTSELHVLNTWAHTGVTRHWWIYVCCRHRMYLVFFSLLGWGETESTWYVGHHWPIVSAPDDRWLWVWSSRWNENWEGKPMYSYKTFPSATLSTTNPTWTDLGSNPARRGGKPATNRLSYGTASDLSRH
jgi:hypothetical protein